MSASQAANETLGESFVINDVTYIRRPLTVETKEIRLPQYINRDIRTNYTLELLHSFADGGYDPRMAPVVVTRTAREYPGEIVIIDGQHRVTAMQMLLNDISVSDAVKSMFEKLDVLCVGRVDGKEMRVQDIVHWASRMNNIAGSVLHMSNWDRLVLVSRIHVDLINDGCDKSVFIGGAKSSPLVQCLLKSRAFGRKMQEAMINRFCKVGIMLRNSPRYAAVCKEYVSSEKVSVTTLTVSQFNTLNFSSRYQTNCRTRLRSLCFTPS